MQVSHANSCVFFLIVLGHATMRQRNCNTTLDGRGTSVCPLTSPHFKLLLARPLQELCDVNDFPRSEFFGLAWSFSVFLAHKKLERKVKAAFEEDTVGNYETHIIHYTH